MKEKSIYLLIYLFTEFFNYILAYVVVFHASLSRKKKRWVLSLCMILLLHFTILYYAGLEPASAISLFTMIVIPAFLLTSRDKKYFLLYPFVVIGTSVIGVSVSFLIAAILNIPEYIIVEGNGYTIFCQCVQGIALIIISGYRRVKRKDSYQINLDWKQYFLFYIVVICLFLMLAPLQELTREYGTGKYINLIGFSVSIACIVLVVITIWYGVVVNREIRLKEHNRKNEEYMMLQKAYYTNLLEQDEKMRRFRHDMNAHMIALKSCCQNDNNRELKDYLNCMLEEVEAFSVENYTGNKGVDAVLRQLILYAKKQQIKIEIEGNLPGEARVNEYDLCTILSNLIKNAIEACEKIEEISKRNIRITIGTYNNKILLSVKNAFSGKLEIRENRLVTTKEDKKNHGLGSGNVEKTVKKYNGILEYQYEKGWFAVEIIM